MNAWKAHYQCNELKSEPKLKLEPKLELKPKPDRQLESEFEPKLRT